MFESKFHVDGPPILNEARMLLYQISESLLLNSVYRLEVETISITLALCFIARAAIRGSSLSYIQCSL